MQIYKWKGELLSTLLQIDVESAKNPLEDIEKANIFCKEFENKYSRFISGNFLDKLNSSKTKISIDKECHNMVQFSLYLSEITKWAFDPTIISLLEAYGYDKDYSFEEKNIWDVSVWYKNILLEEEVITLKTNTKIEFGAIGKWYLIDQIAKYLSGYEKYCINFGGDVFTKWAYKVWLEHPQDKILNIGTVLLDWVAIAASTWNKRQEWSFHHLLNPFTKKPVNDIIAVYTQSSTAMRADGFATALFVSGIDNAIQILQSEDDIEWLIIKPDFSYYKSEGFVGNIFN